MSSAGRRGAFAAANWPQGAGGEPPRRQEFADADAGILFLTALALLRETRDARKARRLAAALLSRGLLGSVCRELAQADAGAASGALLLAEKVDPKPGRVILEEAPVAPAIPAAAFEAVVEAARLVAEAARRAGMWQQDVRMRAKLALVWGRLAGLERLGDNYFDDPDGRVRANALESLWGRDDEQALARYRRALQDQAPRVAANACVGLYLAGETEAVRELHSLAQHPEAPFRAAAAWAMERTGDVRFLPLLAEMRRAKPAPVIVLKNVVQARERIHASERLPRTQTALTITGISESGELSVGVRAGAEPGVETLRPVHWGLEINGITAWDYRASRDGKSVPDQVWRLEAPGMKVEQVRQLAVTVRSGCLHGRIEKERIG